MTKGEIAHEQFHLLSPFFFKFRLLQRRQNVTASGKGYSKTAFDSVTTPFPTMSVLHNYIDLLQYLNQQNKNSRVQEALVDDKFMSIVHTAK